ncbi:MAG: M48 family metallopeptidase [Clostridia bacterium]|nr:M48 family metallopeptidase [Clostridia bacterium]
MRTIVRYRQNLGRIYLQKEESEHVLLLIPKGCGEGTDLRFLQGYFGSVPDERINWNGAVDIVKREAVGLSIDCPEIIAAPRRKLWASYEWHSHRILLNPYLLEKPATAVRTVLFHELCHVFCHTHAPVFWERLDDMLPDWAVGEGVLRRKG